MDVEIARGNTADDVALESALRGSAPKEETIQQVETEYNRKMLGLIFRDVIGVVDVADLTVYRKDAAVVRERRTKFFSVFRTNIFEDVYRVIYALLDRYRTMIISDEAFIQLTLERNKKAFVRNMHIDVNKFAVADGDDPVAVIITVVKNTMMGLIKDCSANGFADEGRWEDAISAYKETYRRSRLLKAITNAKTILEDGTGEGRWLKEGFDDAITELKRDIRDIEAINSADLSRGLTSLKDYIDGERTKADRVKLFNYGIPAIDDIKGGAYSGTFITILAPPKNLKSRFSYHIAHRAAVYFKQNVLVWPLEGGISRGSAYLRAIHFMHYHSFLYPKESILRDDTCYTSVSCTDILDDVLSDLHKQAEETSRRDLLDNTDYGVISFIDEGCVFDTFIDVLDENVLKTNARVLIIDYMTLIQAGSSKFGSRADMFQEAYARITRWGVSRGVTVISPAQVKQIVIDELASGKITSDPRTWAGETSAVTRDSDEIIVLYSTDEEKEAGLINFHDGATRDFKSFPTVKAYVNAGACVFLPEKGWIVKPDGAVVKAVQI